MLKHLTSLLLCNAVVVKKRRQNVKKRSRLTYAPQHRRVAQLKRAGAAAGAAPDRRGSIVTSTPLAPGARRHSAGFAVTPSPAHGKDAGRPQILRLPVVETPVTGLNREPSGAVTRGGVHFAVSVGSANMFPEDGF